MDHEQITLWFSSILSLWTNGSLTICKVVKLPLVHNLLITIRSAHFYKILFQILKESFLSTTHLVIYIAMSKYCLGHFVVLSSTILFFLKFKLLMIDWSLVTWILKRIKERHIGKGILKQLLHDYMKLMF